MGESTGVGANGLIQSISLNNTLHYVIDSGLYLEQTRDSMLQSDLIPGVLVDPFGGIQNAPGWKKTR